MKRDDWVLGSGIKSGDKALIDGFVKCYVLKVKGSRISPMESGNVLIEITEGENQGKKIIVLGKRLSLAKN